MRSRSDAIFSADDDLAQVGRHRLARAPAGATSRYRPPVHRRRSRRSDWITWEAMAVSRRTSAWTADSTWAFSDPAHLSDQVRQALKFLRERFDDVLVAHAPLS